jgi:hypothetical protein
MYQEGWTVLLPHLGKMRAASRIVRADAWRLFDEGDADGGAERLAALYDMSRHVTRDRVLISSLVGISMATYGHELTNRAIAQGQLTEAGRDALIAALERFDPDDAFNTRECIKMEGAITIGWLAKEYGPHADGGARFMDSGIAAGISPATVSHIRRLDGATLVREAKHLTRFYEQALAVWDEPEAVAKLEALGATVHAGAYGELGEVFVPALGKAFESDAKAKAKLVETLNALRAYRAPENHAEPAPAKPVN